MYEINETQKTMRLNILPAFIFATAAPLAPARRPPCLHRFRRCAAADHRRPVAAHHRRCIPALPNQRTTAHAGCGLPAPGTRHRRARAAGRRSSVSRSCVAPHGFHAQHVARAQAQRERVVAFHAATLQRALRGFETRAHLLQPIALRHRVAAHAVAVQRPRQVRDLAVFRQAQAQVVVGGDAHRRVEAANRAIGVGADQAQVVGHEFQQESVGGIRGAEAPAQPECVVVFVDLDILRIRHAQPRAFRHEREHRRQRVPFQQVVAVKHADMAAARGLKRGRQRDAWAVVAAVAEQAEARVAAGVAGGDLRTAISGTVVPQQAFPVRMVLGEQAVQRRRQEARGVVQRDGDADQRIHARSLFLKPGP